MSDNPSNVIGIAGSGEPLDSTDTDAAESTPTGDAGSQGGAFAGVKATGGNNRGSGGHHSKRKRGRPPKRERTAEYEHRNEQRRAERAAEREQPRVEPVSYPAAGAREKEAPLRKNLADLTSVILVAHATLAALVNVRELELSEEEAGKLSEASKEVLKHYPLGVSEKTLAWVNLAIVGGGIYGTRFMAYNVRRGAERRARMVNLAPAAASSAASSGSSGQAAPGQAAPTNGHAANFDLTPGFLTVPPEGETVL